MAQPARPSKLDHVDWESWSPTDLATLLFVIERDRILLIRKLRGLGAGKINGPGGRLDDGESPRQAAVREVEEELGITPLDPVERGQLRFQFVDGYSIHGFVFHATRYTGVPHATDEAIPLWTPLDAIPYEEMWADDRHWLPLLLNGTEFSGRFIFDGDDMLDFEIETYQQY
ncbi:MAG: 8-oxo-dGTP diphosphatase [bacterium]|nr:8-oxo-dGTP diphosphatase [bacterium]